MAYGFVNTPGVSAAELEAVKQLAQEAKDTAEAAQEAITEMTSQISAVPTQNGTLTYTGNVQSPSWSNYDPNVLTIGGQTSATDAGTYEVTFTPKEGYKWWDGTEEAKTASWTIGRATIATPTQSGSLTYTGSAQSPTWNNYDSDKMTIGGDTSGTNAGSYNATFTPTSNYQWSDGSTSARTVSWSIDKAEGSLSLDTDSLTLTGGSRTGIINVTRSGDGAITAESSDTGVATVSVSGTVVTVTGQATGTAIITVKVAAGSNYNAPGDKTVNVSVEFAQVFGVCWNTNNSSTALSRLTQSSDPNGLVTVDISTEPSPAVGTGTGSSPFDSYAPWKDMEEYNIVDNAVSYKSGESGFSRTSNDTVVYIPEFWFNIVESDGYRYFYIANQEEDGFTKHPGSGKYVGRYNTISGYYSRSGSAPLASITRATARTNSKSKGSKWGLYDFATWNAVWLLYLVEYADWDSQTQIGRGNVDSGSLSNTGGTDSMSYHTGRASGTDGQTQVQYRHIEDPWGNIREWIDGANFNERAAYICTDPESYADDTTTNYTAAGVTLCSSGWIAGLGLSSAFPWAFLPDTNGGSSTTYIPDYVYSVTGWRVLRVGGYWNYGSGAGLFYFNAYNASSNAGTDIGARLLFHP